jgi:hypothetical protein
MNQNTPPDRKIMETVALPCGVKELSEIADVFIAQAKRDNRECFMRQNGDYMEFFSVPRKKANQP